MVRKKKCEQIKVAEQQIILETLKPNIAEKIKRGRGVEVVGTRKNLCIQIPHQEKGVTFGGPKIKKIITLML